MKEQLIDLSDPRTKGLLLSHVRSLEGLHRVTIVKHRKIRTNAQNSYYHACIVAPWADWLREMGHEIGDDNDEAHRMLADRFLERNVHDENGEIIGTYTQSTSKLTTVEFIEYNDQCAQFLAEFCEIVVLPPDPFYNR